MQVRIKLSFIDLPLTNKHCNKHCLALTKTTKRQRIEEFSLLVFQRFSLNGIYNFFRCEINDKVTTILPIVATCSSYKNFCVVKLYVIKNTNKQTQIQNSNPRFNASDVLQNLGSKLASHAVVFRGLVLPPPHKRLLTQAPHSFPIVLLPKHPSQSPSRHCLTISNQIAGFNGRFRFPRALFSLWYSLERCGS